MPSSATSALHTQELPRRTDLRLVADHNLAFVDAMRTLAIFAVVLNHLLLHMRPQIGHLGKPLTLGFFGFWGVNCFFVLSGFLLGRPYIRAILDDTKKLPSMSQFYARRFFRIYPLYATSIVFCCIATCWYAHKTPGLGAVASHIFLVQGFWTTTVLSVSNPLWTMGLDAGFYLVLPFFALFLTSIARGHSPGARVGIIAATLAMIAVIAIIYRYVQLDHHPETLRPDFAASVVYERNLIGMGCTFAIGMFVALLTTLPIKVPRKFCVLFVALGIATALTELVLRIDNGGPHTAQTLLRLTFLDPVSALSSALILFGLAEGRFAAVTRAASSRFVLGVATLAYAVYLIHWPVIEGVQTLLFHGATGTRAFIEISFLSLLLIFAIAYMMHGFIEYPFLMVRDRHRDTAVPVPQRTGCP